MRGIRRGSENRGPEIRLRLRGFMIKPGVKREEYIQKLEEIVKRLEEVINSEETDEKTRIKAVDALTRVLKVA